MIISPKYNDCMRELFYNETVRKYFISDILDIPPEKIRSVRLMNPFLWKQHIRQKLGILDILAELNDDTKINIELQVKMVSDWDRRQIFYLSKLYVSDLLVGENYSRLRRCVGISILDFNLTDREQYHSVYRLRDETGNEFSDVLEIHILELRKKLSGQGAVDEWIRFFNARTEEDLDMIQTKNPGILEAIKELKVMSLGKRLWWTYELHMKNIRDEKARKLYIEKEAKAEGLAEGRAEGLAEGRAEGKAQSIVELLEELGAVPSDLKEQIINEKNLERLSKWNKLAARSKSVEEFRRKKDERQN